MQKNFSFATVVRRKEKLNVYLDCCVLEVYWPKPTNNVLLISTARSEWDLGEVVHKKPVAIEFYNSERCDSNVLNQVLCDYTWHSTCDSWVLVVLKFILGLFYANARTIQKDNKANYDKTRGVFLRNFSTSFNRSI